MSREVIDHTVPGGRTQVPMPAWFLCPALLPCSPPVASLAQNTLLGQRMSLVLSLPRELRTSGSGPGVLQGITFLSTE